MSIGCLLGLVLLKLLDAKVVLAGFTVMAIVFLGLGAVRSGECCSVRLSDDGVLLSVMYSIIFSLR